MQKSKVHSVIDGRTITKRIEQNKDFMAFDGAENIANYQDLQRIGLGGFDEILKEHFGMDTIQSLVTTASIPTVVQFLQAWLPGLVRVTTASRMIDEIIGIQTVGSWEDEQVVQQVLEQTGSPAPYTDLSNVPLSSWNQNFVTREIVRFELGMRVGRLEEKRAAKVQINSGAEKRESCSEQLEIQRNAVGFYGYNSGANNTYGFLNDPNLPAYINVANPGSGTAWSVKTFLQITADIRTAIQGLVTSSKGTINPERMPFTLAIANAAVVYLTVTSDYGISVRDWLTQTYPKIRITSAPQLDAANGSANVFYLFADSVQDRSTDDGRTFAQIVPARFQVIGVAQLTKGYEEDYSNATAGVMVKRPYAIYRASGI